MDLSKIPNSQIWDLNETGICGQSSRNKKMVIASTGMRATVRQTNDRTNVSALICVNANGGYVPPFFIPSDKSVCQAHTYGELQASPTAFLSTGLFVQ
ncbi:TPA: hypothetical protein N0F65_006010 [Lagenidium giganteum]|uniref:Uncharacterized protein n=1 Tax=Lagenidium giganteum TaxID=4803 RepID=A0AAV2Z896_9STRA|nr:TPA: hypothetical protein N0F65_006010 [Lagenidium giganteum]